MLIFVLSVLVLLTSISGKQLYLNPNHLTTYLSHSSCPSGYRLAILDDPKDWNSASQLALRVLGPQKAAWIRYGLGWRGIGNERWSIITPIPSNSCHFPPKDLKSFCIPIHHFRLSPNLKPNQPKLPSICEKFP